MSDSDLDPLLRVRVSREELAQRRLAEQKQNLAREYQALELKTQQLEQYLEWKRQQETTLFQALTQAPVPTTELLQYRASMTRLIVRQQQLGEELGQQQAATRAAEAAVAEAKANFVEKHRAAEKCRELVGEQRELKETTQRLREDEELDELAQSQWIAARNAPGHEAGQ